MPRVGRINRIETIRVVESTSRFEERNPMLLEVRECFVTIPVVH